MATAKEVLVQQAEGRQDEATVTDKLSMAFPIDELAHAYERQEALQKHLNEYKNHYNYALFQALPPSEQATRIVIASGGKLQVGMFEPRVVAMDGMDLAVPLTSYAQSGMKEFVDYMSVALAEALARPKDVKPEDWNDMVVVPTPGVTISSRLGECSTCETFIETARDHELVKLGALARQELAEADRREARLKNNDFADPTASAAGLRIVLDREPV